MAVEELARLPYYATGALIGLFLGCLYAACMPLLALAGALHALRFIPGLGWLASILRNRLLQGRQSTAGDDKAVVAELPSSFAVLDSAALGNALYAMEKPTSWAVDSSRQGLSVTFNEDYTPLMSHHNNVIAAPTAEQQEQQVLLSVRDRLASFPLDNMSPTTTAATALSTIAAGLEPEGDSPGLTGDLADTTDVDIGVGPLDPIEGELDLTYPSSSNNIVPNTAAAAAAAPTMDADVQTLLPPTSAAAAAMGAQDVGKTARIPVTIPMPQSNKFTIGAPIGGTYNQDGDTTEFTDINHQHADSAKPGSHLVQGLPLTTDQDKSGARGDYLSPTAAAAAAYPAAAGYKQYGKPFNGAAAMPNAAAAAGDTAEVPDTPRSVSSMHSLSSINTTDSATTVERKKKKGLFASFKQKAVKGRQQVR